LRESLASYTTVGVIGLVNSGKSTLVNKVFKIETVQGNTQAARTTVPLIYNMDNEVEGLSVIDFPGVDDRDDSIGGLAKLLVGLAQIVIFVCEYKRFHTKSAEEWMEILRKDFDSSPILVCLTTADRLYEDQCDDDMIPSCPKRKVSSFKMQLENELKATIGSTKIPRNCDVKFCSLTQSRHSLLNNEQGRQSMRKVGIFTPQDIGDWIRHALEVNIQQKDLADKLGRYLAKQK
jgi:GTPase Era involved in 16S rRNA processing